MPQVLDATYRFPFQAEERFFSTDSDVDIHALHFKHPKSRGLILYFHGNAGSLAGWGDVQRDFSGFPYDFLIVDYRGYGKSTGSIRHEDDLHADAWKIYQDLAKTYRDKQIIVYGRSIGTGIASKLAHKVQQHGDGVQLLLLETPYFSFPDLVRHIYPFVPVFLLRYQLANDQYLQGLQCPIALFHGTADGLIPYDSSVRLAKLNASIQLFTIEGGEHNNLSSFDSYHHALRKVMNQKRP